MAIVWEGIPQVEPSQAQQHGGVVLDVRERNEVEVKRVAGTKFAPMSEMNQYTLDKSGAWLGRFGLKPEDGCSAESPIFVLCGSGRRSQAMCELLVGCKRTHVANITGGIVNWEDKMGPETLER
eukprot:TRINITY_DN1143_c0_g1_i4.p2 TRINITY_DN1143_c0_g1~~TRINITY_DN1143_c0_g1_i4.p2  ORF type:complete len:124 (+),score=22.84 TRINITY_DN1143_c0_g1_i4:480-851(+)